MKLLSVVACCGSCDKYVVDEGKKSLVMQPSARRRGRKRGRALATRGGGNVNISADWTPSLTSIAEDDDFTENDQMKQQHQEKSSKSQMIKRKTNSLSIPRTNHYYQEDVRTSSFSAMFAGFSPTPFLF